MSKLFANVKSFIREGSGVTVVEYSLLVCFIAFACFGIVTMLGMTIVESLFHFSANV